jgi:hypothetical protein
MARSARIRYRLRLRGFPSNGAAKLLLGSRRNRFVNGQRHGLYRVVETRTSVGNGGTEVLDHGEYVVGSGTLVNARSSLHAPFDDRRHANRFAWRGKTQGFPERSELGFSDNHAFNEDWSADAKARV